MGFKTKKIPGTIYVGISESLLHPSCQYLRLRCKANRQENVANIFSLQSVGVQIFTFSKLNLLTDILPNKHQQLEQINIGSIQKFGQTTQGIVLESIVPRCTTPPLRAGVEGLHRGLNYWTHILYCIIYLDGIEN